MIATMTVRPAVEADLPTILVMGRRFLASSSYRDVLRDNPQQMARFASALMEQGGLFVLEVDGAVVGMLGALMTPHYLSGDAIATEVVWWVDPAHRGWGGRQLLEAAEQWAKTQGAVALQMIAPDERVGRLYERAGYSFVESAYQKSW